MDKDLVIKLNEVIAWLEKEFTTIRTGRATPALLDGVRVESYGSFLPINQVGSIGIEDARTIRISPWDTTQIAALERSLREADLGVSVMTDSAGVRVMFPELSGERRVQLKKLAKSKLEDARIAVRAARDDAQKQLEKQFKDGEVSEDAKFSFKEAFQKNVDDTNRKLEAIYLQKEKELDQ